MTSAFLQVDDLSFRAGNGTPLLQAAGFAVPQWATLAIAGPNGAGKTTLMQLLSGTLAPGTGQVLLEGQDLHAMSPHERARRVALVSQHSMPDARLRVRDYVALGQMPIWADHARQTHRDALERVLDLANLSDKAESTMAHLSGGERQRAHIARALAQRPHLLLLDEPTNHLDPDAKGRMLSLVAALGITVVMIVHDLVMIPEFATHVALMKDARVTAFGLTEDVLTPEAVRTTFSVDYLLLPHGERQIPALDIRKTDIHL